MLGGGMTSGQSTGETKSFEKVARPEGKLAKFWRKLRRQPEPYDLVEVVPQEPPQPVRGHVHMIGKRQA